MGHRHGAGPCVYIERPAVPVAAFGHQHFGVDSVFCHVGERRVTELVESPFAAGGLFEQFGSGFVGKPGPPGGRAQVPHGGCEAWFSVGEEHRPPGAAVQIS